jgi:hypothetical protein
VGYSAQQCLLRPRANLQATRVLLQIRWFARKADPSRVYQMNANH